MNKRILNKASKIASFLESNKQKICAIITDKKDRILSIGVNNYNKSHPVMKLYAEKYDNPNKIYLHAEINALVSLPYGKKPYSIYISRIGFNNKPLLAKPCKICQRAIEDAGIKNIYYTKG